jgi:putative endonuclease
MTFGGWALELPGTPRDCHHALRLPTDFCHSCPEQVHPLTPEARPNIFQDIEIAKRRFRKCPGKSTKYESTWIARPEAKAANARVRFRQLGSSFEMPQDERGGTEGEIVFYTYMLRCSDGSYYVGHTESLEARIVAHYDGMIAGYTRSRRPVTLVWNDSFSSREEALAAERRIKGWSRAKKEALIAGDWPKIRLLAKRRG